MANAEIRDRFAPKFAKIHAFVTRAHAHVHFLCIFSTMASVFLPNFFLSQMAANFGQDYHKFLAGTFQLVRFIKVQILAKLCKKMIFFNGESTYI